MGPPLRRRSSLRPAPSPILVSYKNARSGPSTLTRIKKEEAIISELGRLRELSQRNAVAATSSQSHSTVVQGHSSEMVALPAAPAPKRVEILDNTPPTPATNQSTAAQPLNRRSSRVPKRKRRDSSPEEDLRQRQPSGGQKAKLTHETETSNGSTMKTPEKTGSGSPESTLPSTLVLEKDANVGSEPLNSAITHPEEYFKGKEEFGGAIMLLVEKAELSGGVDKIPFTQGWLQCGICCSVTQIVDNVSQFKKYGVYLCGRCIPFLKKMFNIAKRAEALVCSEGGGTCPFPGESSGTKEYCEACFVRDCLLLLDVDDTMYFKLWRAVPPVARSNVPSAPPRIKRYSESRGKVLWVNQSSGGILHVAAGLSGQNKNGAGAGKSGKKRATDSGATNTNKSKAEGIKIEPVPNTIKTEIIETSVQESNPKKRVTRGRSGNKTNQITEVVAVSLLPKSLSETETDKTEKVNDFKATVLKQESIPGNDIPLDGGAISGKQGVQVDIKIEQVEPEPVPDEPDKAIKVIPPPTSSPSDLSESIVEKHGFPVILAEGQEEPPTPLCFACGSAGVNQLVYCCSCCQPFHAYCSEDELLLAAYLSLISQSTPVGSLVYKFRKWKCSQCLTCSRCGCGREEDEEFVGCSLCASSYHLRCAKKMPLKPGERDRDKWVCSTCLRCTSCLIPLTKLSHHLRKLGASSEAEILCLECFRRRQKGAFCPVCFVCYDDNDWDSKMMECDKCQRWIHAACEGLNDERYFVLSSLPEAISYVCRLCQPPVNVGWRHAVESELREGCTRVLELFQRKVIGVSRKRRALSFDVEDGEGGNCPSYFSPALVVSPSPCSVGPLQEKKKNELHSRNGLTSNQLDPNLLTEMELFQTDPERKWFSSPKKVPLPKLSPDENILVRHFNIKPCSIRVSRVAGNNTTPEQTPVELPQTERIPPGAPIKGLLPLPQPSHSAPCPTTPIKLSTPHRVASSFAEAVQATALLWGGVRDFRNVALALLPSYFVDLTQNEKYSQLGNDEAVFLSHFEATLKEVFPWWRDDLKELLVKPGVEEVDGDLGSEYGGGSGSEDGLCAIKEEDLPDARIFQETFWSDAHWTDGRICALCGEAGDFPLNSCGRLLHVSSEAWVHVNCAIWSSEVWEEDTGALQQVEGALVRGKKTECSHCARIGGTLNCCTASCRKVFHFQCAMESGCVLQSDKGVYCSLHSAQAKGQVQTEMHVTRKVFVSGYPSGGGHGRSGSNMVFRETLHHSNKLKVFIGSTRVDRLGHLVPISVLSLKNRNNSILLPVNFRVSFLRLVKIETESGNLGRVQVLTWNSALDRRGDFRKSTNVLEPSSYSVVIDHSKRPDMVALRLKEATAFSIWVKNVDKFVDEFGLEWSPNYVPPTRRPRKKAPVSAMGTKLVTRASLEWRPSPSIGLEEDLLRGVLSHPRTRFLVEQLPGVETLPNSYRFRFCDPCRAPENVPANVLPSGSARSEPFSTRRPHDMFNWLRSEYRQPPKWSGSGVSEETAKSKAMGLPIAMRFRNLKERVSKDLVVLPSHIHGRGLFAQRDFGVGEMLIEYAGELIRSVLCDVRERKYEKAGIGCYMFRVNRDLVVDATMKGNAARFINHSCDPNCESKAVKILGKDHILIFALSNIGRGEELTYDYKFEREEDKLPCACGSRKCRRFLN